MNSHNFKLSSHYQCETVEVTLPSLPKGIQLVYQHAPDFSKATIQTVERAAAASAYIESFYFKLHHDQPDVPRDPMQLRKLRVLNSTGKQVVNKIKDTDFVPVRVLGKGSFGMVKLVNQSTSNRVYAMKVIRKSDMLRMCQEGHVKAERDFLVKSTKAQSQWVVPLISSFQDRKSLYLVMDYMAGGDFLGLLLREEYLDETIAQWYVAEMVCCIQETHRLGWMHRDIKPDNFLICASGHLKISDFGLAFDSHWSHQQAYYSEQRESLCKTFCIDIIGDEEDIQMELEKCIAKQANEEAGNENQRMECRLLPNQDGTSVFHKRAGYHLAGSRLPVSDGFVFEKFDRLDNQFRRDLAKSIVGTSQYMAPEVVRGEQYDGRADWWSIGIILYECLYGRTPFWSEERILTKQKILRYPEHLRFPSGPRVNRPNTAYPLLLGPVSPIAVDLICELIRYRDERLTAQRYKVNKRPYFVHPDDAEEVKAHPFFRGIDWDNIHRQCPPWVPDIKNDMTRWFDAEEELIGATDMAADSDKLPKKRPRDKILRDPKHAEVAMEVRRQHAFLGYTFRRSDLVEWFQTVKI